MPQRPAPPQPSHAILVERGLGGSFTLRWAEHEGRSMKHAWDYEVFWTVPDEEELQASAAWISSNFAEREGGCNENKG